MANNGNVNIKIEVYRDKNSGSLRILAHFDKNASNIFKDNGEYVWLPTVEEKELLDETFDLMSDQNTDTDFSQPSQTEQVKTTSQTETFQQPETSSEQPSTTPPLETDLNEQDDFNKGESRTTPEPKSIADESSSFQNDYDQTPDRSLKNQLEFTPVEEKKEDVEFENIEDSSKPTKPTVKVSLGPTEPEVSQNEPKPSLLSSNPEPSKSKEETVFEVTNTNKKPSDRDEQKTETSSEEKKKPESKGMIVNADSDAIEKALKRHVSDRDKSMVEADEQTIVNKVLSQKKWSKKKGKEE